MEPLHIVVGLLALAVVVGLWRVMFNSVEKVDHTAGAHPEPPPAGPRDMRDRWFGRLGMLLLGFAIVAALAIGPYMVEEALSPPETSECPDPAPQPPPLHPERGGGAPDEVGVVMITALCPDP